MNRKVSKQGQSGSVFRALSTGVGLDAESAIVRPLALNWLGKNLAGS